MTELVRKIRIVESSLGEFSKTPLECELQNRSSMRRSLAAGTDIRQGAIITENMLMALRPERGIPAMSWQQVIGKRVNRDMARGDIISPSDIEDL